MSHVDGSQRLIFSFHPSPNNWREAFEQLVIVGQIISALPEAKIRFI